MLHQLAGEDEEGNGEQRKRVHPGEDALGDHEQRDAAVPQERHRRGAAERDGDRDVGEEEDEEAEGEDEGHGAAVLCTSRAGAPMPARKWSAISSPPRGSAA